MSGGKGAPRVVPRGLPGTSQGQIYEKKLPKWRPNVKVVFFEVQLKAKCYRMFLLRLARLGGKTYGGCLPDASQMPPRCLPDASQMPPRCLPDASQMLPRCFPDAFRMPPTCLLDASPSMTPSLWFLLQWFLLHDYSPWIYLAWIFKFVYKETLFGVSRWGHLILYHKWSPEAI